MKKQNTQPALIKDYSLRELMRLYNVWGQTMRKRINAIRNKLNNREGWSVFEAHEVEIIFNHYGRPNTTAEVNQSNLAELMRQNKIFQAIHSKEIITAVFEGLKKHPYSNPTGIKTQQDTDTSTNPFNEIKEAFIKVIKEAYKIYFIAPAIKESVKDFLDKDFTSIDELKEDMSKILFRIYFSEGKDKVYDYNDKLKYDDAKCQALFDNGIFIPEEWLHQLVRCLVIKSAEEDMKLHNLTPEWLWSKCFRLLMELYQLTNQSINTIRNG